MRKLLSVGVAVATLVGVVAPVMAAGPALAAADTTVVLTFDDGVANQSIAKTIMDANGMDGTFYVNTPAVGTPGYLSWADLAQYQTDGNDIGGHTLTHPLLTTIPVAQAQTEICQDRAALLSHGIAARSFAYPYGAGYSTAAVRDIVQSCGYNSARRGWGLFSSDPICGATGCGWPYAEANPPADAFAIAAGDNAQTATTLAQLQTLVTQAETNGGGVVPIVFHNICDACDPYSTTQATFQAFIDWLALRAPSGTVVKTMAEVVGGATKPVDTTAPVSSIACNGAECSGWYGATAQVSLSATDVGGWGVASIRYTTDGTSPTSASPAYTVPFTLPSTKTVRYRAYDAADNAEAIKSTVVQVDPAAPVSSITCNSAACATAHYASPVQVALSAADTGGSGLTALRYTTDGSDPSVASTVYGGPFSVAATTTVKYRAWDLAGNAEAVQSQLVTVDNNAPVSAVACNGGACGAGWYNAPVQVSFSATDAGGAGVTAIRYTTDGSDPTPASATYSAPLTASVATNFKYRAWDAVGNVEATKTRLIQFDTVTPVSSIACNGVSCSGGWYAGAVNVSLAAADTGGSGVAAIRYTTDGSDPTSASPTYSVPFALSSSSTVKYRAWDNAGNVEATGSLPIQVDSVAPVAAIKCNGGACSKGWYRKAVKVSLSATDAGGSGLRTIRYTTNGSHPTLASPVYRGPFTLSASRNIRYRAFDRAGVAGVVKTMLVKIDTTAPIVTLKLPAGVHAFVAGTVTISGKATDKQSRIARAYFYLDGKLLAKDTKAPFWFLYDTSKLSKGKHKLAVKAFDVAGNVKIRAITVTVD